MIADVIKETLSLLRIWFTIALASLFATISWIVQNYDNNLSAVKMLIILGFVAILICAIILLERKIRNTIKLFHKI